MAGRGNIPIGKVQRAFYLREDVAEALRRVAFERRESQSEIVEQALRRELGMVWTRERIHEACNFDAGDLFRTEEEVRRYFSVENMRDMFGECPYSPEELDEMAEEVIRHRWHMVLPVNEYLVVYSDHQGTPHEAIQIPWDVVRDILGREHRGGPDDDAFLVDYLLWSGAPEWVRTADSWVDEHGWGLIGPEVAGAGEDD